MKNLKAIGSFLQSIWQFIYCFRKVFLAIPIIVIAILLAWENAAVLPEQVGLILSQDGTYSLMLARKQVVLGCLGLTGLPLIFMFASRKAFYPWLISAVTLIVPYLIRLLNQMF